MPISMRFSRLLAFGAVFLAVTGAVAVDSVAMDSTGAMRKSALVRRHQESEGMASLATDTKSHQPDLYVLIGEAKCDGGGMWNHYKVTKDAPGKFPICADACDSKDECVGFDVGSTGCTMYTQKAVALGSWNDVEFKDVYDNFPGSGEHNRFAPTPFDLKLGTSVPTREIWKCFRKTFYKPAESYYRLLGNGTCSGGGFWKRYKLQETRDGAVASYSVCENACNQRDECIGFDVGTWQVTDDTTHAGGAAFTTTMVTTPGCFMYTQKAVTDSHWPAVQAGAQPEFGEGYHDAFTPTPDLLSIHHSATDERNAATVAAYEAVDATGQVTSKCYAKTHWVSLEQSFFLLGNQRCDGPGGLFKHYKYDSARYGEATLQLCKDKCDEKTECLGLDYESVYKNCRLYTQSAISAGGWSVQFQNNAGDAFPGTLDNAAKDPETPWDLKPGLGAADPNKFCIAKTHWEHKVSSR